MPSDGLEWLMTVVLAVWFAGTVAYQLFFKPLQPLTWRYDPFRLLVGWRLFSKLPKDLRLWYRDRSTDGHPGPWAEVPMNRSAHPLRALWNPDLSDGDAYGSFLEMIANFPDDLPVEQRLKTPAIQAVRMVVNRQPRPAVPVLRQFELRQLSLTHPQQVTVLFTSDFQPCGQPPIPA